MNQRKTYRSDRGFPSRTFPRVGCFRSETNVFDETYGRQHGDLSETQTGKAPLQIPSVDLAVRHRGPLPSPKRGDPSRVEQALATSIGNESGPLTHQSVISYPGSAPTGPAPNMIIPGKIVTLRSLKITILMIATADLRHPIIASIPIQKLLAKREKRRVRQTIVLQNDRLLHLLKNPIQS